MADLGAQLKRDLLVEPYALRAGYPRAVTLVDRQRQTRRYLLSRKILHGLAYLELSREWHFIHPLTGFLRKGVEHRLLIYEAVRRFAGVSLVVDSSKSYLEATSLYCGCPDETRIILLTRDGRGVMYSNIKMKLGRKRGLYGWTNYYLRALPLLAQRVSSSHVLPVRYEDLVEDPGSELARICGFLGLEYEASMLDFSSHAHHVTNGNDMRFASSSDIRVDASWRANLTPDDFSYFDRHAGSLNRRLGYPEGIS